MPFKTKRAYAVMFVGAFLAGLVCFGYGPGPDLGITAPGLAAAGPVHAKSVAVVPVPVSCNDWLLLVRSVSLTPTSDDVSPAAGPSDAVKLPS